MTIHYHGAPIWGDSETTEQEVIHALWNNGNALVSYAHKHQLDKIIPVADSIILDNGAYSAWKSGRVKDWNKHWNGFFMWTQKYYGLIDWFIAPDVIDGTEQENDDLLKRIPTHLREKAAPVWHVNHSIERLVRLCSEWDRVCIGGLSGKYKAPNSKVTHARIQEAFEAIYLTNNLSTKIHGLKMLDGRIMGKFPFSSCDSSTVAVQVPLTRKILPELKGKLTRTAVLRAAKEKVIPPTREEWLSKFNTNLFEW